MEHVWSIIGQIVVSMGGVGVIIFFFWKKIIEWLSNRLSQVYAHQLSAELEKYKSELDKRLYVSQKHFDLELSIYKELMGGIIGMTSSSYQLFPPMDELPRDLIEEKKVWIERYNQAIIQFNATSEIIFQNAPFIDEKLYTFILDIRSKCLLQLIRFKNYRVEEDNYGHLGQETDEGIKVSVEINKQRDQLITDIRKYLHELEISVYEIEKSR